MNKIFFLSLMLINAINLKAQRLQTEIDSLQKELTFSKTDTSKIKILDALSFSFSKLNPDSGLKYANTLKEISKASKNNKGLAAAYIDLGLNYSAKYEYKLAINNYLSAIRLYKKLGNEEGEGAVFANISLLYLNQSDYTKALEYAFKALTVFESIKAHRMTAIVQENIGTIYLEQKQFKKTLFYYSLAHDNFKKISDLDGMARVLGNKGIVLNEKGEYAEALKYHTLALQNNQLRGVKMSEQINLANIAITYMHLNNYEKSLDYHLKALAISKELKDKKSIGINLGNAGEVYLTIAKQTRKPYSKNENLKKSILFLKEAKNICIETNFKGPLVEFSQYLSEAYSLAGKHELALNEFKEYSKVKDSLNSIETQIKISSLETKRELELKNKEIILKEKQMEISLLEAKNKKSERIILIITISLLVSIIFLLYIILLIRSKSHRRKLSDIAHTHSHEVRAPLARILGLINVLDYENHNPTENKKIIRYIQTAALELDEVIKKVLDKTYRK